MRNFATLGALRRATAIVAGAVTLTLIGASAALAEVSPSTVTASSTTLYWSGQGATGGALDTPKCGTLADPGANPAGFQNGSSANNYELWIFQTDHGSVTGPPTLTINQQQYGNAYPTSDGTWQFTTPYIDPSTITQAVGPDGTGSAFASFVVGNVGGGQWKLTISHGCAGSTPPPPASPLNISAQAAGSLDNTFTWGIAKSVDQTKVTQSGDSATFQYTVDVTHDGGTLGNPAVTGSIDVSNPNGADVAITGVTDQLSAPGSNCTVDTTGDPSMTIPAHGDVSFPFSCTLTGLPSGTLTDTADVSWGPQDLTDGSHLAAGDTPTTINLAPFTSNPVDDSVVVTDTLGGNLGTVHASDPSPTSFTYSHTFTGIPAGTCTSYDNTATFTTDTSSTTGSDHKTVQVCRGADLTASKTAHPSFDRTYLWKIAKSADKTQIDTGGTANYTVQVNQTGVQDGNWLVKGVVTVNNPNDFEAVSLTSASDIISNNGNCQFDSLPVAGTVVPVSGSVQLPYTCTYTSAPSPASGHNTATVSWDNSATGAATPDGSATTDPAPFDFGSVSPTGLTNQVIHVTDPLAPSGTFTPVTATDPPTQPASATFHYSHQFQPPATGCATFNNTATITETGQNASASVKECSVGALTMGFWHNQNGQKIITSGASTAGVCNSGTWLRNYAPFQDLSATASCTTVATYFQTVFNAANASGTGTPMLKAQMLATALDVYFSDPNGGGNKIGAFNGNGSNQVAIGNVKIDTTAWKAAFGGQTSMTVSDMLTYASNQLVGGVWYGGNKALVTTAISAFNAINNDQIILV